MLISDANILRSIHDFVKANQAGMGEGPTAVEVAEAVGISVNTFSDKMSRFVVLAAQKQLKFPLVLWSNVDRYGNPLEGAPVYLLYSNSTSAQRAAWMSFHTKQEMTRHSVNGHRINPNVMKDKKVDTTEIRRSQLAGRYTSAAARSKAARANKQYKVAKQFEAEAESIMQEYLAVA